MSRRLVRVPLKLIKASRVRIQSSLQDGNCFWQRPSQHLIEGYSSSGILHKVNRNIRRLNIENDLKQTEDTSSQEERPAKHKDASSSQQTKPIQINTSSVSLANATVFDRKSLEDHLSDDLDFDTWVSKNVKRDPQVSSVLKVDQYVCIGSLNWKSNNKPYIGISVTFSNPQSANALSVPILTSLTDVFNKITSNKNIKGVCLTSATALLPDVNFCAGAHLGDLLNHQEPHAAESFIRKVSGLCTAIRDTPVPVVALITGSCIGAGLEVAASCDIRVATEDAKFSMPEVQLRIPSVVQARLLCDIVGWGRARYLMLTGNSWNAQEAYEAGLVSKVFDSWQPMMGWVARYMRQTNTTSTVYERQKKLMQDWENQSVDAGIEAGVRCFADTFAHKGDVSAFQASINRRAKIRQAQKKALSLKQSETSKSEDNTSVSEEQAIDQSQDEEKEQMGEGLPTYIRKIDSSLKGTKD